MSRTSEHSQDLKRFAELESVGATYTKGSRQDQAIRTLIARTFAPYLRPVMRGLQLGYAEGVDTALLAPLLAHLDIVEGSEAFLEAGREQGLPNAAFHHALFERFLPEHAGADYDAVFAVYVLEHVADPVALLRAARAVLAPEGLLFVVTPNARALSRQLALHMGLVPALTALTPHDLEHGHRRVYDRVSLNRDLRAAGCRIVAQGGIMLKILADFQLDRLIEQGILGAEQLDGLYSLGFEYPDLCGSLFAVCDARSTEDACHDGAP